MDQHPSWRRTIVLFVLFVSGLTNCSEDDSGNGPGSVEVVIETTGVPVPALYYTLTLGDTRTTHTNANGIAFFTDVPAGTYTLTIEGIHVMCNAQQGESIEISVMPGKQVSIRFSVQCTAKPLVFISNRKGANDLYRMNLDGSGAVRLATNALGPRWSPDGASISFLRDNELYVIGEDGRDEFRVTTAISDSPGAWSPDGQSLAFIRAGELYIVNSDGSELHRVANLEGEVANPDWGKGGESRILIEFTPSGGETGIYTINPDGSGLTFITPGMQPAWSPDASRIAFTRFQEETYFHAVFTMKFPDGLPVQRTETGVFELYPRWSPDNMRLTFTSYNGNFLGSYPEIHIGSPDNQGSEKLTSGPAIDYMSDWRP